MTRSQSFTRRCSFQKRQEPASAACAPVGAFPPDGGASLLAQPRLLVPKQTELMVQRFLELVNISNMIYVQIWLLCD